MLNRFLFFVFLVVILVSCTGNHQKEKKAIIKNNMDFPSWEKQNFYYVDYRIPTFFRKDECYSNFTLNKDHAINYCSYQLETYFSVEKISEEKATDYQYLNNGVNLNLAILEEYGRRILKNAYGRMSLPFRIKGKHTFNCVVVSTNSSGGYLGDEIRDYGSYYYIGVTKKSGEYYAFQLIGSHGMMGFLFDDFKKILYTVK